MKRILILGAAALGLASCEKKKSAEAPPLTVTVAPVVQKDVYKTRTWVGLLDGFQNAQIRAQVTGYLMTQNYKEGSFVKKGDVLFTIDKRPFEAALAQAQADYARTVAAAQLSQATLQRQTQLYKTKVISQQEYDVSYAAAQSDVAAVAAQQANVEAAQINLNYCTITAPFDGIAGIAQAQIGDLVGPGGTESTLTQMSQVDPIKVNFSITEEEYLTAAALINQLEERGPNDKRKIIELTLADGRTYPEKGYFDFVNRQVNTATGTIQVTALFPNKDNVLRPGLFARVSAPVKLVPNALLVPQAAVIEMQGHHLVSTVDAKNVVTTHPVKLGFTEGPYQVIEKGLSPGDRVVVGGVEKVRTGMTVRAEPYQPPAAASSQSPKPGAAPSAAPK